MEGGRFVPTEQGTPQGGVISPLLLNVALDGMEGAAGVRYLSAASNAGYLDKDSPALVRYADNFVVLCHSREEAVAAKARLAAWLAERGLAFNEDKTRIVHLNEGFDFLGFHVQRRKDKLLITPSKASLVRIRKRIATELRSLRGAPALS
jgi:RNA-directed DNA polymerase